MRGALAAALVVISAPPSEFRGDNESKVVFTNPRSIMDMCGEKAIACVVEIGGEKVIYVPNPCRSRDRRDRYANVVCHELGHKNGWPADHSLGNSSQ